MRPLHTALLLALLLPSMLLAEQTIAVSGDKTYESPPSEKETAYVFVLDSGAKLTLKVDDAATWENVESLTFKTNGACEIAPTVIVEGTEDAVFNPTSLKVGCDLTLGPGFSYKTGAFKDTAITIGKGRTLRLMKKDTNDTFSLPKLKFADKSSTLVFGKPGSFELSDDDIRSLLCAEGARTINVEHFLRNLTAAGEAYTLGGDLSLVLQEDVTLRTPIGGLSETAKVDIQIESGAVLWFFGFNASHANNETYAAVANLYPADRFAMTIKKGTIRYDYKSEKPYRFNFKTPNTDYAGEPPGLIVDGSASLENLSMDSLKGKGSITIKKRAHFDTVYTAKDDTLIFKRDTLNDESWKGDFTVEELCGEGLVIFEQLSRTLEDQGHGNVDKEEAKTAAKAGGFRGVIGIRPSGTSKNLAIVVCKDSGTVVLPTAKEVETWTITGVETQEGEALAESDWTLEGTTFTWGKDGVQQFTIEGGDEMLTCPAVVQAALDGRTCGAVIFPEGAAHHSAAELTDAMACFEGVWKLVARADDPTTVDLYVAYDFGISRLRFVDKNKMEVEVTLRSGIDGQTPALRQNVTLRFLSADTPITATQQKTRTSGTAVTYTFLLDYPANADAHCPIRVQAQP